MSRNTKKKEQNVNGVFDKRGVKSKQDALDLVHFVYEAQLTRIEMCFHKIFILCLVLIILLFGTNIAWFAYSANAQTIDMSKNIELDNSMKMMALKPIHFATNDKDNVEYVFKEDGADNSDNRHIKKTIIRNAFFAVAC